MTREEAFKIAKPFWGCRANEGLDMLVKLGMLKLEEPEELPGGANYRAFEILKNRVGLSVANVAIDALIKGGLKIVEK